MGLQRNKKLPQVFVWAPSGISFPDSPPESQGADNGAQGVVANVRTRSDLRKLGESHENDAKRALNYALTLHF